MVRNASRRPNLRKITLAAPADSAIARITSLAGDPQTSDVITSMLDRYLHLIHRNSVKLSDRELCAVIDALGQTWHGEPHEVRGIPGDVMSAVVADRLDTKWAVDAQQLRIRLERSSATDRTVLAEFCLGYWMLTSENEAPQVTLDRVRQLLQPSSPSLDTRPPIRRVSATLFDQAESGDYPTPTISADLSLSEDDRDHAEADDNAADPVSGDDPSDVTEHSRESA